MQQVELSQEEAAVFSAIQQVRALTGFGRVLIEIRSGHVRLIEISSTVLIQRNDDKIEKKDAHEA